MNILNRLFGKKKGQEKSTQSEATPSSPPTDQSSGQPTKEPSRLSANEYETLAKQLRNDVEELRSGFTTPIPQGDQDVFSKILENDASGAEKGLSFAEIIRALPGWAADLEELDSSLTLMEVVRRLNSAFATRERRKIVAVQHEALIVLEHLANSPSSDAQQVADAHFHKATIYAFWADRCDPLIEANVRLKYLRAAHTCIRKARSMPQGVHPTFLEVEKNIEAKLQRPHYLASQFGIYKIPGVAETSMEIQPDGKKYEVYTAKSKSLALEFLRGLPTDEIPSLYYVIVETPEGNVGKDLNGMFDEATGKNIQ
jgi:hypothetical protein